MYRKYLLVIIINFNRGYYYKPFVSDWCKHQIFISDFVEALNLKSHPGKHRSVPLHALMSKLIKLANILAWFHFTIKVEQITYSVCSVIFCLCILNDLLHGRVIAQTSSFVQPWKMHPNVYAYNPLHWGKKIGFQKIREIAFEKQ